MSDQNSNDSNQNSSSSNASQAPFSVPQQDDLPPTPPNAPRVEIPFVNVNKTDYFPPAAPTNPNKKFGGNRLVATILGALVLVVGVGAGLLLILQPQIFRQNAFVPTAYESAPGICADQLDCSPTQKPGTTLCYSGSNPQWCCPGGSSLASGSCSPIVGVMSCSATHTTCNTGYKCNQGTWTCESITGVGNCSQNTGNCYVTSPIGVVDLSGGKGTGPYGAICQYGGHWTTCAQGYSCSNYDCVSNNSPTAPPTSKPPNPPPPTTPPTIPPTLPPKTATPSPSPTPTRSPSPSPTPTPTHSPSPSPSPTPTRSPSPTPTRSPSPTPTPTRSPSPSPSPTRSPSPTPVPQCNSNCTASSQCPGGMTCSSGFCRNPSCTGQANCLCPTATPSPSPSPSPSPTPGPTAVCSGVKAYDTTWVELTSAGLSGLRAGNSIYFCVAGTTTGSSFDMARFTINGVVQAQTTTKRPNTNDFCQYYTIPSGVYTFDVTAQIHHLILGWIGP